MMHPLPKPSVLAITDRHQLPGEEGALLQRVEAVLASGCRWVSLREKDLAAAKQETLARAIKRLAESHGSLVTIHGDPMIAARAKLDGVHLPEAGNAKTAREMLGADALIGQSVHTWRQAEAADPTYLNYIIAGPVFDTISKPGYGPCLQEKGLADIVRAARVPVIAIGGVNIDTTSIVCRAGASGIAIMGGIMRALDPGLEMRSLIAALESSQQPHCSGFERTQY